MSMVIAAAFVAGAGVVERAEARDRRDSHRGRIERRVERRVAPRIERREVRYLGSRDVYVIRDYYRPHYRPLPRGARHVYARHGHLPPGWARRIHPVPVYVERRLPVLPRGYHRGIIDGHAVVYNSSGLIIDVAVLF
jgi:hypothetical protein